jgi:hypothetical protein
LNELQFILFVRPIDDKQSHAKAQSCLLEYEIKFEAQSGNAFMLQVDKMFHCIVANQSGNVYDVAFLEKKSILNHPRS